MDDAISERTLVLTERVPQVCRLSPDAADFLLQHQPGRLELLPTRKRHAYRLTATGHVGVIVAPTCRIVIRPKIPLRNLFHLVDPDTDLPADHDAVAPAAGDEVQDFLAAQFIARLRERIAAGLQRGYVERTHYGPVLQGRIDVAAQVRDAVAGKVQLHSQLDDFTIDVACNRIIRATAELLSSSPLVGDGIRAELRRLLASLADVGAVAVTPAMFDAAAVDPLAATYQPLLGLCRLLLDGLGLNEKPGMLSAPAFLLNLDQVFERYMSRGVMAAFASSKRYGVAVQKSYPFHQPVAGQVDLVMRPDMAIERAGQPCLLVDAKWKRTAGRRIPTDDLYQMLAYAAGLAVGRVVLVYPGKRDRAWKFDLLQTPVRVAVWTLRVTGTPAACRRSLRRFGRHLRQTVR